MKHLIRLGMLLSGFASVIHTAAESVDFTWGMLEQAAQRMGDIPSDTLQADAFNPGEPLQSAQEEPAHAMVESLYYQKMHTKVQALQEEADTFWQELKQLSKKCAECGSFYLKGIHKHTCKKPRFLTHACSPVLPKPKSTRTTRARKSGTLMTCTYVECKVIVVPKDEWEAHIRQHVQQRAAYYAQRARYKKPCGSGAQKASSSKN